VTLPLRQACPSNLSKWLQKENKSLPISVYKVHEASYAGDLTTTIIALLISLAHIIV
jgi:hypothetical protein